MERLIQQVLNVYPNDLKYVVKNFPLPSHRHAYKSAVAALAANEQGKYWEFHEELLKNHRSINDQKITSIAENLKLDMTRFTKDLESAKSRATINEDVQNGRNIGVRGTPSVFLNGKRIQNRDLANLSKIIKAELEALGGKSN